MKKQQWARWRNIYYSMRHNPSVVIDTLAQCNADLDSGFERGISNKVIINFGITFCHCHVRLSSNGELQALSISRKQCSQ